jgi:hypothetical protein
MHLRAAGDLAQRHRRHHLARQVRIVEGARVAQALVRHQLEVLAAERVAVAVREIGERHAPGAVDLGVHLVHLAGETVGRQPLGHRLGIEEGAVEPLGAGAQHAVQAGRSGWP